MIVTDCRCDSDSDKIKSTKTEDDFGSRLSPDQLEFVRNVTDQFVAATNCKTAALVTASYYLRSIAEFANPSLSELKSMTLWLHDHATQRGTPPHESADDLADRIEQHMLDRPTPWHLSIDAAIHAARDWIAGHGVPPEVRWAVATCGIRGVRQYIVVCVCWALQQMGRDWYICSRTLSEQLPRHGIDAGLDGRTVRKVLLRLRSSGVTLLTAESRIGDRCNRYRFDVPAEIEPPEVVTLTRGNIQKSSPSAALAPLYSGALSPPSGGPLSTVLALPVLHDDQSSPQRDQPHSGPLGERQHIVAHRHQGVDRGAVLEAAAGREAEIVEAVCDVDLRSEGKSKYMTCPVCGRKKKLVANRTGGLSCFRCGRLGGNIIDSVMTLTERTFPEAIAAIAEHLGITGKQRIQVVRRELQVRPQYDGSSLDTILHKVAAETGVSVAGLQHYGATPAYRRYSPRRNTSIINAVARIPLRRPDGSQVSHLDIGVACRSLRKGLCPEGKHQPGAYLPNDYRTDDGRPAVLVEGPKDAIRAWDLAEGESHAIGLQTSHLPADLIRSLQGRRVLIVPDCDDTGRRKANRWQAVLQRHGIGAEIRDPDPDRTDGAGIRELAEDDTDGVRQLLEMSAVHDVTVDYDWIDSTF